MFEDTQELSKIINDIEAQTIKNGTANHRHQRNVALARLNYFTNKFLTDFSKEAYQLRWSDHRGSDENFKPQRAKLFDMLESRVAVCDTEFGRVLEYRISAEAASELMDKCYDVMGLTGGGSYKMQGMPPLQEDIERVINIAHSIIEKSENNCFKACKFIHDHTQDEDVKRAMEAKVDEMLARNADVPYSRYHSYDAGSPWKDALVWRMENMSPDSPLHLPYTRALVKQLQDGPHVNDSRLFYALSQTQLYPGLMKKTVAILDEEVGKRLEWYDNDIAKSDNVNSSYRGQAAGMLRRAAGITEDPDLKRAMERRAGFIDYQHVHKFDALGAVPDLLRNSGRLGKATRPLPEPTKAWIKCARHVTIPVVRLSVGAQPTVPKI